MGNKENSNIDDNINNNLNDIKNNNTNSSTNNNINYISSNRKAYFHLPGLFEFYEFYKVFLSLFYEHREYFYDWCDIGSIYGAPADCIWGGGRAGFGDGEAEKSIFTYGTIWNIGKTYIQQFAYQEGTSGRCEM